MRLGEYQPDDKTPGTYQPIPTCELAISKDYNSEENHQWRVIRK